MFSSLSFNQPARRFWKNRAEPDFGPGNAASLMYRGRKPAVVTEVSTPSRRINAAGRSVGILLYLTSFGLTAAAISGILFGTGFWLLASPVSETITDSGRGPLQPNGNALQATETVLKLTGETETPHSAAVNLIPGSPLGEDPTVAAVAPQQNKIAQELSPASPSSAPPVEPTSVPQPVSGAAVSPPYPIPLASPPAAAAAEARFPPETGAQLPATAVVLTLEPYRDIRLHVLPAAHLR
jgi:hypothetical protein